MPEPPATESAFVVPYVCGLAGANASAGSGLAVTFAVGSGPGSIAGGTNLTFTGTGSVAVVASQAGDANWNGAASVTNTYTVAKAAATVFLGSLVQTYDGTARTVTATTMPAGLTVEITYDGAAAAPTNVGTYAVTGTVDDAMYQGVATGALEVAKASQTITFGAIGNPFWTNRLGLAATASSGLGVSFAVAAGPASIAGGTNLAFTGYGEVRIAASQAGNAEWAAAPTVTNVFAAHGPEWVLLGTNGAAIASSNEPSAEAGTDFGAARVGLETVTRVFTLTNGGTGPLTILDVEVTGTHTNSFALVPATNRLAAGASTNLTVVFDPQTGGTNTATCIVTFDGTNAPYYAKVAGFGHDGAIGLSSGTLAFAAAYAGADPSHQVLVLTNAGTSGFTWTNTTSYGPEAAGWLTVAPSGGELGSGASEALAVSVAVTNLNAGTYYATNTVTAPEATNSPQVFVVELVVNRADQAIVDFLPADGAQFVLNTATTVSAQAQSGLAVGFTNLAPEIASLVGFDVAFTSPGVARVQAFQAGNSNWNAAAPVVHEWRVGGLITNVAPGRANVGGGIDIVIQGVALGDGADITNVTLCGVAATIVAQSVGDVTVTVEPAAAAATGDVTVASASGGFMVLSNAFEYLWLAAPAMRPATDVTLYDLTAHWTGVAGATAYFLDVGLDAGFAAHLPGYELRNAGAATNASVDGLLDETDYWLRAYSWNAAGRSLASPALAVSTPAVAFHDFDADGQADLAAYQTATGDWKFRSFGTGATWSDRWGWSNAVPVPADYDGDGVSDVAVYHPASGTWRIRNSTGGSRTETFGWGATVPVPSDYDGDGTADLAVYHAASGRWYFRCSTEGDYDLSWGWSAAVPVPADYDGDGRTDVAVYHPATGDWYVLKSLTQTLLKIRWGWANAVPVPGDYEGDGKADIAVFHRASGNWHIRYSSGIQWQVLKYGWAGTIPVQADYDGDGTTDRAIYHPATGNWSIRRSSIGTDAQLQLGGPGHVPVLPYPMIHAWFGLP